MEVAKVLCSQQINTYRLKSTGLNKSKKVAEKDYFEPSFQGYEKMVTSAARKVLNNDLQVEKTFTDLFEELAKTDSFSKTADFSGISKTFYKHGFRGLLHELWKSNPQEGLNKYLQNETKDLVKKEGAPVFQIIHFDKFGFSKNSPNDVKFVFMNPKNDHSIQCGLNKKGELEVWQNNDNEVVITTYHLTTGNKKCVVEHPKGGNPETTYYNADGTKSFFKNLLWGGVAIVPK